MKQRWDLEAEMGVQVKSSTPEVVVKVVTADIDTKEGRNSIAFSQSVGHHVIYRRKRVYSTGEAAESSMLLEPALRRRPFKMADGQQ